MRQQSTLWNGETNGMVPSLGAHTTQTPYAPPGTVAVQSLFGKYMNPVRIQGCAHRSTIDLAIEC